MISYLYGKILDLEYDKLILLINSGIGYEIFINELIFSKLQKDSLQGFYIYHHITDSNQMLFGFLEKKEKKLFEELIKISGIGGKIAIQILGLGEKKIILSIKKEDIKFITSVKGVGKKMAEKIILELKDKFKEYEFIGEENEVIENIEQNIDKNLQEDIISTLVNMGYSRKSVKDALGKIPKDLKTINDIMPAVIKEI